MRTRIYVWVGLALWCAGLSVHAGEEDLAVVLCNTNMAGAVDLAAHYAGRRGIPADRICELDLPIVETMTRADYDRRLRDPLLAWLREQGLITQVPVAESPGRWRTSTSSIRYLVSIYGVPLRIANTESTIGLRAGPWISRRQPVYDRAAVDSELALGLVADYPLDGLVPNSLYGEPWLPGAEEMKGALVLITGRLDGPSVETVRRMIDDSVEQERYGLLGRACFDLRSIRERGYVVGDRWIVEAWERMAREGYDCVVDLAPETIAASVPVDEVVYYLGWYAADVDGPFRAPDFRFARGAIACHLHSSAAASVRSTHRHWAGLLLERGAVAVMGAVYEPYLAYTPNLEFFTQRLCAGNSFGESALLSQKGLSWQVAVIGDPLYRPFRYALDQQIANLEADQHPGVAWAYLRKINLRLREGRFDAAIRYGREKAEALNSAVLWEKVGDVLAINGAVEEAQAVYDLALAAEMSPVMDIRVTGKCARLRREGGEEEASKSMLEALRSRHPGHRCLRWAFDLQPIMQGES